MPLWEFPLESDDGTAFGSTIVAEGANQAEAEAMARGAISGRTGLVLSRPSEVVSADVEARWREVLGDASPGIVSDSGRLARYARGIKDPSRANPPVADPVLPSSRRLRLGVVLGLAVAGLLALLLLALVMTLISTSGAAAPAPVRVCNRMTVELAEVTFVGGGGRIVTLPAILHPGECAAVAGLAAGSYGLQFIERAGASSAICRRAVTLSEGEEIAIAPGDGAVCMM